MEENAALNFELKDFETDVIEKSRLAPVVVDFWAPWCGPCQVLGPVLGKLAYEANDRWHLIKVNVDENQELAQKYGVRGIPYVLLFKDGEPVDGFTGAMPEAMIQEWLEKYVPSPITLEIEETLLLHKNGETQKAKDILEQILIDNPKNLLAKVTLAEILVFSNPGYARELVAKVFEGEDVYEKADAIKTFADLLNLKDDHNHLEDSEAKSIYLGGIDALSQQDFATALEKFIEVIIQDKEYDNEGGRRACIAIFHYLGEDHETTKAYRKRFDMSLY